MAKNGCLGSYLGGKSRRELAKADVRGLAKRCQRIRPGRQKTACLKMLKHYRRLARRVR